MEALPRTSGGLALRLRASAASTSASAGLSQACLLASALRAMSSLPVARLVKAAEAMKRDGVLRSLRCVRFAQTFSGAPSRASSFCASSAPSQPRLQPTSLLYPVFSSSPAFPLTCPLWFPPYAPPARLMRLQAAAGLPVCRAARSVSLSPSASTAARAAPRVPDPSPLLFASPHTAAFSTWRYSRVGGESEARQEREARRRWAVLGGCLYFLLMSVAFAFVPLYEAFCQSTGYGGYVQIRTPHGKKNGEEEDDLVPTRERSGKDDEVLLEIDFASHCNVPWEFEPLQKRVIVAPGESALAFYRARNKLDKPVIGISLYNVMPPEAGIYFNKIQCFCFEEQMLNPRRAFYSSLCSSSGLCLSLQTRRLTCRFFFFIDPDILDDPRLEQMKRITLSYVFNESDANIPDDYKHLSVAKPTDKKPPLVEV
ncbi:putative cytochrome c oxidase assembly protein COX11 protein [Besnoitia besnoiti]|uniref:Putative cytochrome c oxidase assembly protein COX11 protein n=1 Tax=Besnoitia besnoiti TaxID=94643 RepID=A0A2A9MG25_BESBE|nr:putative cytochrome c oxidase assembly protein COX11 protein [Besnoitia besnoiti]PFH34603.1 putative cytochrome c oxidase assembly protein COX11 protein [Besnoitia besnoiti]